MATNGHSHQQELSHIREDISSLKHNLYALTTAIQEDVKSEASDQIKHLRAKSKKAMSQLEAQVQEKPTQSLLTAFAAGVLFSVIARKF